MFGCKRARRHKCITPLAFTLGALLLLLTGGCVPDPQRMQTATLFDRLVAARAMFGEEPPRLDKACNDVGDVQTRLYGEPGLSEIRPAWAALRDAAGALQSICGHSTLLAQPTNGTLLLTAARQRWQQGIDRETQLSCDYLRSAAVALGSPWPC